MTKGIAICAAAGVAAMVLMGAVPAKAQYYGFDEAPGYDPDPGYDLGPYAPYPGPRLYRAYPPPGPAVGFDSRREVFIGPYGEPYRRCRPHRACYNSDY